MYKIIGADQKEYGPVSNEEVCKWIAQGRANARSRVQAEGSSEWKELASFPEFANFLKPPEISVSPAPARTSSAAIASLVLGLLGLFTCGVSALAGLITGIVAMSRISKSGGQVGGKGLAIAGIVISAVLLLMAPIMVAMLVPAVTKAKQKASSVQCMNNVKQLNLALVMYADDHNRFPSGETWCDATKPYTANSTTVFRCPKGKPQHQCHYALNTEVAGRALPDIKDPARTVLVFEVEGGWNVSGGKELLPASGRHAGAYAFGFADGHVEIVKPTRLPSLNWEP